MIPFSTPFRPTIAALALAFALPSLAQAPPKEIPPPGIMLSDADRTELTDGAAALRKEIDALTPQIAGDAKLKSHLPDVEIFHKAVDWALRYDEIFTPKEVDFAKHLLAEGRERVGPNARRKNALARSQRPCGARLSLEN